MNAAYGEVCVARIGDFVCRVDHLQGGHELDGRENRAQTLRPSMLRLVLQLSDLAVNQEPGAILARYLITWFEAVSAISV